MPSLAEEIDSYQDTVWALVSLHLLLTRQDGSKSALSSGEFTSRHTARVKLSDDRKITPDFHLVVPAGMVVGEIKMSFATLDSPFRVAKIEAQLRKYDDALVELGRLAGRADDERCVILLVHHSRIKEAERFVQALAPFKHRFGLIDYVRQSQRKTFYSLELRQGEIVPASKNALFQAEPMNVALEELHLDFPDIQFYDSPAPDLFVADIFWQHILTARANEIADSTGSAPPKVVPISAKSSAKKMSDLYGIGRIADDAKQSPSTNQLRQVLDSFVRMGLAKKVDKDNYEVRRVRFKDPIPKFQSLLAKADAKDAEREKKRIAKEELKAAEKAEKDAAKLAAKKEAEAGQLPLFSEGENTDAS